MSKTAQRKRARYQQGFEFYVKGGIKKYCGGPLMYAGYCAAEAKQKRLKHICSPLGMTPSGLRFYHGWRKPLGVSIFKRMWSEDLAKHYPVEMELYERPA